MKDSINKLEHAMSTLHKLAACSSVTEKRDIIWKELAYNQFFARVLIAALNPYQKYGFAKKVPVADASPTLGLGRWDIVDTTLNKLSTRQVTGAAAATEVIRLLNLCSASERILITRILLKDLRCGVGATLVNSVSKGLIPEFGIMLATPLEPQHLKKLRRQSEIYLQAKKNGDRSVVICGDTNAAYSRKGYEQLNYGHIVKACSQLCDFAGEEFVFDGEVIVEDFWGTRGVKKKAGNEATQAVLHIFDIVRLEDWQRGITPPYSERRSTLRRVMHRCTPDMPLVRVPSTKLTKLSELTMDDLDCWRDKFIEMGEEGLIIRLDEPYNFKTRSSLLKYKKMQEADLVIAEVREGEAGKKYEGMAAKILVELGDLCPGETCEVGLEGDMEFRKYLWKHRSKYVGKVCEVHYQELTENQDGTHKLQFGVGVMNMKKIREDKS